MSIKDDAHRRRVQEALLSNPGIIARAKVRRRKRLRKLGIASGGGQA